MTAKLRGTAIHPTLHASAHAHAEHRVRELAAYCTWVIAGMIDGAPNDKSEHLRTLTEARPRPHGLDDATVDQVERVGNH